jgi:hypothetical protein
VPRDTAASARSPARRRDGDGFGPGCVRGNDCDNDNAAVADAIVAIVDRDGDGRSAVDLSCVAPGTPATAPGPLPTAPDCDDDDDALAWGCACSTFSSSATGRSWRFCSERYDHAEWTVGCREHSQLALFPTAAEQDLAENELSRQAFTSAWINGTDVANEGVFVDDDGDPFRVTFMTGEPNNTDGAGNPEHCLELRTAGANDLRCEARQPAMCGPLPLTPGG